MISIILVNFNNSIYTINCLKSLENQTYKDFEIIIVDNNSNEFELNNLKNFLSSNNFLTKINEKIKLFCLNKNTGFTGGNNYGIRKSKGDIILFLNSDTNHESAFLESMVNFFNRNGEKIHVAQPNIHYFSEKWKTWALGGKINKYSYNLLSNLTNIRDIKNDKYHKKLDYVIGTAFFIRKKILDKIGFFDTTYFMYCEESDLCMRARLKGFDGIFCNDKTTIFHDTNDELSASFKKFFFRNRVIFSLKFFPIKIIIIQFFLQFIAILAYTIDWKKLTIDYYFLYDSIKGILKGIGIGLKNRLNLK